MAPMFDAGRLKALQGELELVRGPAENWSHLSMGREYIDKRDNKVKTIQGIFDLDTDEDDSDDEEPPPPGELRDYQRKSFILLRILRELYTLARENENSSDFQDHLPELEKAVNLAAHKWCTDSEASLHRSLAHSKEHPLVRQKRIVKGLGSDMYDTVNQLQQLMSQSAGRHLPEMVPTRTPPWTGSFRPHPLSTPFSRFRESVEVTPTLDEAIASAVYSARCEIMEHRIGLCSMMISPSANILLEAFHTGWNYRNSSMQYHLLDSAAFESDMPTLGGVENNEPGLASRISDIAIEETRQLILCADNSRIKSFRWGTEPSEEDDEDDDMGDLEPTARPVHTFDSDNWEGPLITIASGTGKIIRAGSGTAGVWDLDTAPTHGADGTEIIGRTMDTDDDDDWRDDPDDSEPSSGSRANATITFQDRSFTPGTWQPHPSEDGIMLTGASQYKLATCFSLVSIDLESGKFVTRYLGHGGGITQISTVPGQAQTFVTACQDGFVRLWDTRMVLPALTIPATGQDPCMAAVYANPDGIPTIFTGALRGEHIRLWDVRAQTPVYDLSTGNNAVESLVWDYKRNSLWAATSADSHEQGYREATPPKDEDDDWEEGMMWPTKANHWEDYFGVVYNAGDNRLFRYAFKEAPNVRICPETEEEFYF